jgi:hypothetical protein
MSLATPFSAAWMAGPALLPFSDLTWMHVVVGLAIPYGMAGLGLGISDISGGSRAVDTRTAHRTNAVREREVVR